LVNQFAKLFFLPKCQNPYIWIWNFSILIFWNWHFALSKCLSKLQNHFKITFKPQNDLKTTFKPQNRLQTRFKVPKSVFSRFKHSKRLSNRKIDFKTTFKPQKLLLKSNQTVFSTQNAQNHFQTKNFRQNPLRTCQALFLAYNSGRNSYF